MEKMDNQVVEKCPECGNYTQGVPVYTTERKMVQKATKGGTSKIVGAVIGGVIGLPFFGIGAVPGAFIGFIIGSLCAPSASNAVAKAVDESIYDKTQFSFTCLKCGKTWNKVLKNGQTVDSTPDKVLREQKDKLQKKFESNRFSAAVRLFIALALSAASGWYLLTNDLTSQRETTVLGFSTTVTDFNFLWLFIAFLELFFTLGVIIEMTNFNSNNADAGKLAKMSIGEFRNSNYRT